MPIQVVRFVAAISEAAHKACEQRRWLCRPFHKGPKQQRSPRKERMSKEPSTTRSRTGQVQRSHRHCHTAVERPTRLLLRAKLQRVERGSSRLHSPRRAEANPRHVEAKSDFVAKIL